MKKYNVGMVLGKFYPFHLGHKFLIDETIKNCNKVVVYACSLSTEVIGPEARYEAIKKTYEDNKNVVVLHIVEDLPQEPNEHPDFWNIWYKVVYDNIPKHIEKIDVIFGSEDYIIPFSKVLNLTGIIVDKERTNVPISGTLVRSDINKYWDFLPEQTKNGIKNENSNNRY